MLIKIALVQHRIGEPVGLDLRLHLFRKQPDFVCFPEYWGAAAPLRDQRALAQEEAFGRGVMARLSGDLSCTVIGGTVVSSGNGGRLYNEAPVSRKGLPLGSYRKMHPTARERESGIEPGDRASTFEVEGLRVGVAICADCLEAATFDRYREEAVDLIFVPNASPHRPGETVQEKHRRDQDIFVRGAVRSGAYIIKVCGVGSLFGSRLQGRSLVAAPWGIIHQVPPEEEHRAQVITVNLSTDELHEFRNRFAEHRTTADLPRG